ncbi:MAG: thioredoxin domain-containing protein [Sediminibacterium sp.]
MNHLINETSPYLLQHAHNPVDWYPWGETALERARQEDKPILVSIGYAACHWCHVMERESFEDTGTAGLMNRYFINIKIDREERPDLDHIYMDAVQAMTGSGGWPLNVFLTPEGKPFYGGTYFPPVRAHNRASWKEVLEGVYKGYTERREEMHTQAESLTQHLLTSNSFGLLQGNGNSLFEEAHLYTIAENMLQNADTVWGGFGAAPKFPQSQSIQYLLRQYHFTKQEPALQQAILSLDKMIDGGIYDQLGGGFARYSTDREWLAPHFEKMLYDNALLVGVMAEAYQLTRMEKYARAIRETLAFIEREMTAPEHGFYSALDADSEGVEGKFYTWQKEEIDQVLGEDAPLFCAFYDITAEGNWEHTNILRITEAADSFAVQKGVTEAALLERLQKHKQQLMRQRAQRTRPLLDDKILLGWNALMNTAYSKAYAALGDAAYLKAAVANMQFMEDKLQATNGSWYHTYKAGKARIPAFLDDYAYLIQAYIHLQEVTGKGQYLLKAGELLDYVAEHFGEEGTGFYYYTHRGQQDVIVRKKEVYDGATPSGNAIMAQNLLYLSKVFDKQDWYTRMRTMVGSLAQVITKYPNSFGAWALCLQAETRGIYEIAVTGQQAMDYLSPVLKRYIPNKILQVEESQKGVFPLLRGKEGRQNDVVFYLCKDYACSEYSTAELEFFLANV